jgi:hypothetical protein
MIFVFNGFANLRSSEVEAERLSGRAARMPHLLGSCSTAAHPAAGRHAPTSYRVVHRFSVNHLQPNQIRVGVQLGPIGGPSGESKGHWVPRVLCGQGGGGVGALARACGKH